MLSIERIRLYFGSEAITYFRFSCDQIERIVQLLQVP